MEAQSSDGVEMSYILVGFIVRAKLATILAKQANSGSRCILVMRR